mgnify:FL=1
MSFNWKNATMGTLSQIPLAEAVEISSDSVFGNT